MHVNILGDRRSRLLPGWVKETLVGVLGDSTGCHPGAQVTDGGFSLLGDRRVDVPGGEGAAIRINAYGAFCDRKVIEGT